MGMKSKRKGKAGELELARKLREYGYNCGRTAQYNGKAEDGEADLRGLPGIHIECKRVEKLNLYDAVNQAKRDSEGTDDLPVVFHRRNHHEWLVAMPLDSFIEIYREYASDLLLKERTKE